LIELLKIENENILVKLSIYIYKSVEHRIGTWYM